MTAAGWERLLEGWPWFQGQGSFPIFPNSESMPPVRLVRKPYGTREPTPVSVDDPWSWPVTEYEEGLSLQTGLTCIAAQLLQKLGGLCRGDSEDKIAEYDLRDNPYWPPDLAKCAATLAHERFVVLLPLALSRTQDDMGRTPWTLFGSSEQGPAHGFWKSFFTAPGQEAPAEQGLGFFRRLLARVYGEPAAALEDLRAVGFRILPLGDGGASSWPAEPLPSWAANYLLAEKQPLAGIRYLLTFRPFRDLPAAVKRKYLAGGLHLLPFPGSLIFWGMAGYLRLRRQLPFAMQIPLLRLLDRQRGIRSIRVPQSGWFREPGSTRSDLGGHGPLRETYRRTHRWARVHRYEDDLVSAREEHMAHVLFGERPDDIGLYNKPMARNVQLWTEDFRLLLDGPTAGPPAGRTEIEQAAQVVKGGGLFGYRFLFPAMRVGRHELYWHRPLAAFVAPETGKPTLLEDAPLGYLTAYLADRPDLAHPLELWPRLLQRELHRENVELFRHHAEEPQYTTVDNVRKLLHAWEVRANGPLPRSFARQMLMLPKGKTLDGWLRSLPKKARNPRRGHWLVEQLRRCLEPADSGAAAGKKGLPAALTYHATARRSFEVAYWNQIAFLSKDNFLNKNNADCVLDGPTQAALKHHERDLEPLGEYLLDYYEKLLASEKMTDKVLLGELPFPWQTQYEFPWMGGWLNNQDRDTYHQGGKTYVRQKKTHERNLIVVIPGRDRGRAVIMADHYDTAFMHDYHDKERGGTGARIAAPGADDNCSATASLMLGAPRFLELSRQGRLACDVWLIHLTGEEYPAEGQGADRLCEWAVEGTLKLRSRAGKWHDLSGVRIQGLYVLDMVAHNTNRGRDVFQISPGNSREALWLAYQAHVAAEIWNASAEGWNRKPGRRGGGRGRRSRDGKTIPAVSRHPRLHGEVRLPFDVRSTLYNTDGQGFSDVGIPVVLFMENYDISRNGYHDSQDDMSQINLDYGAAVAAITIEAVARAATEPVWSAAP
jgi:hypothetical protein